MPLPKLVRDKIPSIIEESGRECVYETATKDKMGSLLEEKMREECKEFFADPSIEEASDIYEVFKAILDNWGIDMQDLISFSQLKEMNKGSFKDRIVLQEIK